jgi:hypothetical protein
MGSWRRRRPAGRRGRGDEMSRGNRERRIHRRVSNSRGELRRHADERWARARAWAEWAAVWGGSAAAVGVVLYLTFRLLN